ncbi:12066_t:CDS:1 [Funneliformis geosporum]|uniref:6575_t:CDS:1 n=1 Tax=Funneliformis geosporum TaxID=1117311 RepID=A0A9W4SS69_9GLOM|nr:6575_t:CDS:1 [Funneliformis geosporum]CAI2183969.1 12066_t:CDS:1 [Funneliformis geosporum]
MMYSHTSHYKRSSSSHLHVKRGVAASNNALIVMAMLLTVVVILFLLILVFIILNQRRKSRNRISDLKLKPLQLVITKESSHLKNNQSKRESQFRMDGSLSVPVALAKPTREFPSEARSLILSSTDLKV